MLIKKRFEIKTFLTPELLVLRDQFLSEYLNESPAEIKGKYSPTPVCVGRDYIYGLDRLCPVLCKAFTAIVSAYFSDERIRQIYQLDQGLEEILKLAETQPYQPGLYRPDLLYDTSGYARICEIGARYPLNGWMYSYYQNAVYETLYTAAGIDFAAVPGQDEILSLLVDLWDTSKPVALVHDDEAGTEVFEVERELLKSGGTFISLKPQDLDCENGKIIFHDRVLDQFILEMDREELRKFEPEVLRQLVLQANYFNDIRTLILVHDKRILAVLWDEDIMRDYLSAAEYDLLRPWLIPSFVIRNESEIETWLNGAQNLILKLNSGGRGIGAYVKSACTADEWESVLRDEWKNYLIQHFVDQQEYEIEGVPQHLVGMLLCRNDRNFGAGVFRGSTESIVNIHRGRAKFLPVLFRNDQL
jgi:hypothetical protein